MCHQKGQCAPGPVGRQRASQARLGKETNTGKPEKKRTCKKETRGKELWDKACMWGALPLEAISLDAEDTVASLGHSKLA